jgi:DNA primase
MAEESGVQLEPARSPHRNSVEETSPGDEGHFAPAGQQQFIPKSEMLKINEMAIEFYYRQTRSFPRTIEYFLGRGLSRETIREFRLGYAPPGWSEFLSYAKQHGVAQQSVVQSGLAIAKPDGKAYDRFRDRIMFPIFDTSRRPIGFGGRGLTPDAQPKYLNSPETLLYQKNKTLYGLHVAQHHIKQAKSVIVVEGYMDFLTLYQAGIKNVIATSGTALTDTQARILQRFSSTVYLVFDGDSAGIGAAKRAVFVLAPCNLDVRVLILTDEKDPDDYIKKHGKEAFSSLLANAVPFLDFILKQAISEKGIDSPQKKSDLVEYLIPLFNNIPDGYSKDNFIKRIASFTGNDPFFFKQISQLSTLQNLKSIAAADYSATIEGHFLRLLLSDPTLIKEACNYVTPETFTDQFSGDLFSSIVVCFEKDPGLDSLIDSISDPEKKRIISMLFAQGEYEGDAHEDVRHSILRLQRKFLKNRKLHYRERMKSEMDNRTSLLKLVGEDATQQKEIETPS